MEQRKQICPDGGWGWMVVFGSFMVHVITDGVTYSFGIFYDEFLTYFKEGKGATSWILSILVGVTFCSGPISSILVNYWGCRVVTIIGAILAGTCMILSIFAAKISTLYISIGLGAGFGFGLIYLPAIVSVSIYFEKRRSLATGIAVCGSGFGTFVYAPIITKLLETYDWKQAMLIVAGTVFLCIIFGALFRPLNYSKENKPRLKLDLTNSVNNYYLAENKRRIKRFWSTGELRRENNYGTMSKSENLELSTESEGGTRNLRVRSEIMARKDIFYQASINTIPGYTSELALIDEDVPRDRCSVLKTMFNWGLFKDWCFVLFSVSNFLTSIGFNVPYVYIVSRAKSLGIDSDKAGMLLAVIGIANTVGRILLGYLSDKSCINRLYIYNLCLTFCGLATALSSFCLDFYTLALYASVFGFTIGAYVGLTSVILVDLLGLDKLTNAFGLLLLFQGIASLIGPPIAGGLYDIYHSYDPGFYVAGFSIAASGLILFLIPVIQKYENKKKTNLYGL